MDNLFLKKCPLCGCEIVNEVTECDDCLLMEIKCPDCGINFKYEVPLPITLEELYKKIIQLSEQWNDRYYE